MLNKSFIFIIKILLFFIITSQKVAFAETYDQSYCDLLSDRIKSNQIKLRLDQEPETYYWGIDLGIILQQEYSRDDNNIDSETWNYKRDDENHIIVFNTHHISKDGNIFDVFRKLNYGDKIISLNGKSTSELSDDEIDKIFYPEDEIEYDKNVTDDYIVHLEYIDIDQNEYSIKIKPLITFNNYISPFIQINNFKSIDSKKGMFELNFLWWYEWNNIDLIPIYNQLHQDLSDLNFEIDGISDCQYPANKFESLNIWHPSIDMENIVEESNDFSRDDYFIWFYPEVLYSSEDQEVIDGIKDIDEIKFEEESKIAFQWEGNSILYSDFNFKAFPFDSQILKLDIVNMRGDYPMDMMELYKTFSNIDLTKYSGIPDWTIIDKDLKGSYYFSDYYQSYMPKYTIEFRIERNYFYYIYKILIPIFIILVMAWSALWIRPSELESRLTVTIVCLLSLIAYNYIYDKDLPKLDYLTLLDYTILLSYLFAAIPTILSVISYNSYKKTGADIVSINESAKIYIPSIFIFVNMVIWIVLIYNNPNVTMYLRELSGF